MGQGNQNLDWLSGGGEMGALIRAHNWLETKVGPPEAWPQSLKTALSICLGSRFPMFVWWGRELTVFYNDAYIPFTGFKHPKYLGRPAREQWAEIWDALRPLTDQVFDTGNATWAESMLLFMTRSGFLEETYFTFSYSPIRDESGAVGGIINPCQETTERVLGERRLKTLHDLGIKEIKNVSEVGTLASEVLASNLRDIPFALIYFSDPSAKSAKLIGHVGIRPGNQLAPENLELSSSADLWSIPRINQNRRPERIESLRSRFGDELPDSLYEEKPDSAYVMPIEVAGHESPAGYLILGISPRLAFDDRYQDFFSLVGKHIATHLSNVQALEEEKRRAETLAELDRAKTEFFSNVSHEFRTPLTLLLGPIENMIAAKTGDLTPELRAEVEIVYRNALRLLKLVNSLLDFSRIEANRAQAVYEATDLASMTRDLASTFRAPIEAAGLRFSVTCAPLEDPLFVDRDMWEKIVLNLLSNALKYTLDGEICLSLQSTSENIELSVRDTGIGIPEGELTKVFQRFHRVQGAEGRTNEGTGIGLALVQDLVKLHGGSVTVQSVLGKGSNFSVRIPKGSAHLPQDRLTAEQKTKAFAVTQADAYIQEAIRWIPDSTSKKARSQVLEDSTTPDCPIVSRAPADVPKSRIVLVDDNADMREYVQTLLTPRYEVIPVPNGKGALEVLSSHSTDLVISDIMMPVMNGIELLKAIRSNPVIQTIPVILLSARAGEEAKTSGIEVGADDYVTKPFSAKELQARVQTHLNLSKVRGKLLRELEQANRELETFSYSVSHDLRAPLRSMMGFGNILLEEYKSCLDERGQDYLLRIRNSAQKMGLLIEGLINFSRLSKAALRNQTVDLSKIVETIASELQSADPTRQVDFIIAPNVTVVGDPQLFEVALQNLINNAWKFTSKREKTRIEFGVREVNRNRIYFVQDNGAGFDMQYADKLFGVFNRLHSEKDFAGTGIGLATVQRVIHRHGGTIWAEGKPNEGATFCFSI